MDGWKERDEKISKRNFHLLKFIFEFLAKSYFPNVLELPAKISISLKFWKCSKMIGYEFQKLKVLLLSIVSYSKKLSYFCADFKIQFCKYAYLSWLTNHYTVCLEIRGKLLKFVKIGANRENKIFSC